uniref:Protein DETOXIFICATION n=2 Tax=Magnoliopsida TaxID=3398 RepID=A0A6V7QCM1_ANACO|nr:unnamed protein product [Ananas comosus var. bracteatus]
MQVSGECRDKSESRWREIDAKRTLCDASVAFGEKICKIAVFLLAVPDFERNPRSPYLRDLVKVSLVKALFYSAVVDFGLNCGFSMFIVGDSSISGLGHFQSIQQVVPQPREFRAAGISDRGCSGLLGAVGVDGGPVSPFWRRIVPRARDLLVVRPVRVGYLTLACESSTNLTETLVNSLGRAHECHSGMRFQCDECRSFCWTVLEPATLGVVYGAARYRQGGSVLGSPGEIVSDAFPYLLVSDSGGAPLLLTDDGAAAAATELAPLDSTSIWKQMKEIALFAGPATGLWICGPLMSLIDTMVIGQGSSLELAALGPATVFCDYLSYIFMFLSIATSNMVATSLAKKDKELVQHQISILLFVAFACGLGMFMFTRLLGPQILAAFTGPENLHIVPAANTYAQIRGFAWPAILVGMVAQSASLGMKDSWGPLKALTVASAINGFGDIFLCSICGYGIAGAAWATMVSQVVAAFMMMQTLNKTGFQAFSMSIPSVGELFQIFEIAAPVFVTMTSKVAFYSLLTYFATSMGTITLAAHQVMINVFCMCTVWGEPLSQTAQSFMPELIHGVNRSLVKARMLLKSLVIIGAITGLTLGVIGTSVPRFFPNLFTTDRMVIGEMHKVLIPYFYSIDGDSCNT